MRLLREMLRMMLFTLKQNKFFQIWPVTFIYILLYKQLVIHQPKYLEYCYNNINFYNIFQRIFSHIWYNSEALEKIRKISYDRSVSIVWLPTHKSKFYKHLWHDFSYYLGYLDFLLISLLCYHHQIQLPAICAAEDFQSSKLLGEALRRCGAFFIRRKFKEVF